MKYRSATLLRLTAALFLAFLPFSMAAAQDSDNGKSADNGASASGAKGDANNPAKSEPAPPSVEDRLKALEQIIERQQREIEALREMVGKRGSEGEQTRLAANDVSTKAAPVQPQPAAATTERPEPAVTASAAQGDATQKRVEELYKKFGAIRFSGDIRLRYEPFTNQGFDNPVEPPARSRLRVRARLALDGTINKHFDWGFRLATNSFVDPISTNQTLTDFFNRKPFGLERAFIRFDSKPDEGVGVQLVAGKFEPTFRRTQMVFDDDLNVEGASEAIYFKSKSPLQQVKLVAFQLPFFETSSAKDGVLYGGQAQADVRFSSAVSANFNAAYYAWNRADYVVQRLGAADTQVGGGISNGAGVNGGQNGALGTTNRIIRNAAGQPIGYLANFNLLDILGNLTWQAAARFPVTFTLNYVRNLSDRIDNEEDGYWTAVQVGQTREKGDLLFGYTFTRIEQDAVLVPFNFSDILASNSRAHIPTFGYQVANNVTFQWTGLFSQRVNNIFPNSGVDRYLNRMQFDVIYKF